MTYKQLRDKLNAMPLDRLNDNVTVYDPHSDEYIAAIDFYQSDTDVLDNGHYVLSLVKA